MTDIDSLITINDFAARIGVSRFWFYRHVNDPGMPRRVYVGGKPMLSLREVGAYIEHLKRERPQGVKRKFGRPRRALT